MALAILSIVFVPIGLDVQYLPTILNGLTTAVSVMIGFTVTILALIVRTQEFKAQFGAFSINLIAVLLILSFLLLFNTYWNLLAGADFHTALRIAMINLIVCLWIICYTMIRLPILL